MNMGQRCFSCHDHGLCPVWPLGCTSTGWAADWGLEVQCGPFATSVGGLSLLDGAQTPYCTLAGVTGLCCMFGFHVLSWVLVDFCPPLYLGWPFTFHCMVDPAGKRDDLLSTLGHLVSSFGSFIFLMVLCYR